MQTTLALSIAMDLCSDLYRHGLSRAFYFDAGFVHGAQVHQHGPIILLQQHIGGLKVPKDTEQSLVIAELQAGSCPGCPDTAVG